MLMLVGQSAGRTLAMSAVARELSLSITVFNGTEPIAGLLRGNPRCIVFLAEDDVTEESIGRLEQADNGVRFGTVICGNRESLRVNRPDRLFDRIERLKNVQWVDDPSNLQLLCTAARACQIPLLRASKATMQKAINNLELIVHYQPQVERGSRNNWTTREAEALIRWRHPQHGLLEPLEFLPELEVHGLIGQVTETVLRDVATQLVIWRGQGLELNASLNLASSLLRNRDLPGIFESIVKGQGLGCESFTFEIIEQEIANSNAPHLEVLKDLRAKGFRVSLDDFGVAVSSLGSFQEMPFDEIKIHGSVLAVAKVNPVAQKVLSAVTGLAHNLGITVCAEGVEDEETVAFLKTIRCDRMQGFIISEAVMPDAIRPAYTARRSAVEDVA
jgi:EAL domain-containing protein (putative c-di-GMP-specific phosphodiesterase class I)